MKLEAKTKLKKAGNEREEQEKENDIPLNCSIVYFEELTHKQKPYALSRARFKKKKIRFSLALVES